MASTLDEAGREVWRVCLEGAISIRGRKLRHVRGSGGATDESERKLLDAGWTPQERGGLVVWRRPDGLGSWYSQSVALQMLEKIEIEHRAGREEGRDRRRR